MTQGALLLNAQLNPPQAKAVAHVEGPLLVFAGAGSGKTRVITYRVANLIANHKVPPHRILAVTFTNKAAGEMRERLDKLLGDGVSRDIWVGTFHSTCARLLRRHAAEVGLTRDFLIYDDGDQKALLARALKARNYDEREHSPKTLLGRIMREKQEGRGPADVPADRFDTRVLREAFEDYEKAMKQANAVDFEDLIGHVTRIAEARLSAAGQELRERFDHVLVDEFQDTNQMQYRLVRSFSLRTRNLCVVGDDDQSIYRWRGGDVRLIRNFKADFPDATVIKLEENYRSTGRIVRAALAVISPSLEREPKQLFTSNPDGGRVNVVTAQDEHDEAAFITGRIKALIDGGADPESVAVFYRIHAMSRVVEEAMRASRVPYRIVGGIRFFERAEVKDLLSYLRVLLNPRSDVDLLRIINVPARGIGDSTIAKLTEVASARGSSLYDALGPAADSQALGAGPRKKLASFLDLLESYRRFAVTLSPSKLADLIFSDTGYKKQLQDEDSAEGDARLQNIQELIGSIQEYEAEIEAAGETGTLAGYLERVTLSTSADEQKGQRQVSLMSIHSAKGLEFDNVFLLGLEEGIFPYERKGDDSGCDLEEERRLAYVAITRARKQLFLLRSMSRTLFGFSRPNPASRFLRDLPREDVAGIVTDNAGMSMPGGRAPIRPVASPSWSQGSPFRPRPAPAPPPRPAPRPEPDEHGRVIERDPSSFIDDDGGLRKGTRVKHQRFGVGTVVSADTSSQPPRATVYFASWGEKKVLLEHLMPLGLLQNLRKRSNNPPPCHEPPSAARLSAMRAKTPFDMLPTTSVRGAIHVVVESPAGSRNKYKYDPKLGLFRLNRVLPYEASFPFDYGFTPNTRSGDKDPLDVMLLGDAPTFPGCVVRARPVGVLRARKEGVVNDRLLAVPLVSRIYHEVHDIDDLPPGVLHAIERFFRTILNIEGGEHQLGGFHGAAKAAQLIAKTTEQKKAAKVVKETVKATAPKPKPRPKEKD